MCRRVPASLLFIGNVVLLTVVLLFVRTPVAGACEVWVPLANRVERCGLIVTGRIVAIEPGKYSMQLPESRATSWGEKAGIERIRRLDQATLVVDGVLKGEPEFVREEFTADGDTVRSVDLIFDGPIQRSDGFSEEVSTDSHTRAGEEGVWFLGPAEVDGAYRGACRASRDDVGTIREYMHTLNTAYAGWTPGFAPDGSTTLVVCGSDYNTHAGSIAWDDGSVVLLGMYRGDFFLAGQRQFTSAEWDYFMACLDAAGNVVWCRSLGCGSNISLQLARGLGDTFLLMGSLYRDCSVMGSQLHCADAPARVILCVSRDARLLWRRTFMGREGPTNERRAPNGVEGIWVSPEKDTYRVAGTFCGEVTCGATRIRSMMGTDWFIGTLAEDGRLIDLRAVYEPGDQRANLALWNRNGQVVMAGTCGWRSGRPRGDHPAVLVSSISPDDHTAWADTVSSRWSDRFLSGVVGPGGMVVAAFARTSTSSARLICGDTVEDRPVPGREAPRMCAWSANGKRLWDIDGGGDVITFGEDGKIYCAGSYGNAGTSGNVTPWLPPSAGDRDIFIECYDAGGKRKWSRRDGGLFAESVTALHLLPGHRAILVGTFDGTTYLAGHVMKPQGWSSAFVLNMKLPTGTSR